MAEKVVAEQDSAASATSGPLFASERLNVCPSCDTANPGGATRCSNCGGSEFPHGPIATVPATCPNCLGDRPFVPGQPSVGYTKADGTAAVSAPIDERYHGDCPHCSQTAAEAQSELKKLRGGDSSTWGKGAPKPGEN